ARGRGNHDSVDKLAQFDKPMHRQPRINYNPSQAGLGSHPGREKECRSIPPPHEDMFDAAVLILTGQNKCLPGPRMTRIGGRDFLRRTPGTMTPLRTKADGPPRLSTRWSRPASSTASTRGRGSPMCSPGCPIIQPEGSASCCPGTGNAIASWWRHE